MGCEGGRETCLGAANLETPQSRLMNYHYGSDSGHSGHPNNPSGSAPNVAASNVSAFLLSEPLLSASIPSLLTAAPLVDD